MSTTHESLAHTRRVSGWRARPARQYGFRAMMPLIFCLMLFWPFGGGGKKTKMTAGRETPAAHGTVAMKTGRNGNSKVTVKVKNLAQPDALTPPKHTYVVWVQPPGKNAHNKGALHVNNSLEGQLSTVTPYHAFNIFITAENYPQVAAPQGQQVLWAHVSM